MAEYCLGRLASLASEEEKALLFDRKLSSTLTRHIAIRTRKYDSIVNAFVSRNPSSVVVNLGCGFDTRYWRIHHEKSAYMELDLPELIEMKKTILKDHLHYELETKPFSLSGTLSVPASDGSLNVQGGDGP